MSDSLDTKKLLALLEQGLDLTGDEQQRWLHSLSLNSAERQQLELLLDTRTRAADVFNTQYMGLLHDALQLAPGMQVGAYRLIEEIARGGMGQVYLANRIDGAYEQKVAIKFTFVGLSGPALVTHFERERKIFARVQHPNIAVLHDAGTFEGVPYVVMEYVAGVDIASFAESRSVVEILTLFRKVCEGVQHAHSSLVIHRDLKPSNILVTAAGVPKILDFGIAVEVGVEQSQTTRAFTHAYASPEQIAGGTLSTASDVYSLGIILREVLGRQSYDPELNAIVSKATSVDPALRYATAGTLADDLGRYLRHETLSALPLNFSYSAKKFAQRNPLPVIAFSIAIVSLAGGVIAFAYQANLAEERREFAEMQAKRAQAVTDFFRKVLITANPGEAGPDVSVREVMQTASERLLSEGQTLNERDLGAIHLGIAYAMDGLGDAQKALAHVDAAIALNERLARARDPIAPGLLAEAYLYRAAAYAVEGKLAESVAFAQRAEALFAQGHGEISQRAVNLSGYGLSVFRQGNAELAEQLLLQALALPLDESSTESLQIKAGLLNFLSNLYGNTGREQQAIEVAERAIGILARINPNSYSLFIAKANLATGYHKQSRFTDAEAQYADIFDGIEGLMADNLPSRLIMAANRAANLIELRGVEAALPAVEDAYESVLIHAPDNDRIRGLAEHVYASALCKSGYIERGESLARQALARRIRATNEDDFYSVQTRIVLAECLVAQGDMESVEEARALLESALVVYNQSLGVNHATTQRVIELLAAL